MEGRKQRSWGLSVENLLRREQRQKSLEADTATRTQTEKEINEQHREIGVRLRQRSNKLATL